MRPDEELSVADMLRDQRAQGVSVAELARMLDRSPKMVRKVLAGESSGEAYRHAVTELHERGRVSAPPPRRRGRSGQLVPVRAPEGSAEATRVPEEAPRRKRGRFTETMTPLTNGARLYEFTAPKTKDAKGRAQANATMISRLRSAAKGQRWDRRKVKFDVTLSNGHTLQVGSKHGYQVSSVLGRSREFESDPMAWLKTQVAHRYKDLEASGVVITDVSMTVYSHRDEKSF
jgi:hypothetical protein